MAKESTEDFEDSNEKDNESMQLSNTGCSPYSRVGETLEDRIRLKEEKRLKSSQKGIARRTGLVSRKQLNPISKKQKKKNIEYKKSRDEHYSKESNRECFCCGRTENLSIHHKDKRGNNISKKESFITLCIVGSFMDQKYPDSNHNHTGGCHGWVEANKSIARELNLLT